MADIVARRDASGRPNRMTLFDRSRRSAREYEWCFGSADLLEELLAGLGSNGAWDRLVEVEGLSERRNTGGELVKLLLKSRDKIVQSRTTFSNRVRSR